MAPLEISFFWEIQEITLAEDTRIAWLFGLQVQILLAHTKNSVLIELEGFYNISPPYLLIFVNFLLKPSKKKLSWGLKLQKRILIEYNQLFGLLFI